MYYNKAIFDKYGLEVPTTYDEYVQVCDTLKENGVTPVALASTADDAWLVSQYIQQLSDGIKGEDLFNSIKGGTGKWNDEGMVEAGKLFQEEVQVNAHIIQFPGMSGHADQEGLLKWAGSLQAKPDRVFVTHGEDKVTEIFAEKLWDEFRYPAMAPFSGTVFALKENEFIEKTVGIPIQKETTANAGTLRTRSSGNAVFDRLVAAGQRLLTVITRNKGGANKDLSKFADQINSLCDKWDR